MLIRIDAAAFSNTRLIVPSAAVFGIPLPDEWFLVDNSMFGESCNKLGVHFWNYYNQPNFCGSTTGAAFCCRYGGCQMVLTV